MELLVVMALFAQVLVWPQAYTTVDATNADQLDLATQQGLLGIELGTGCDGIGPGMNVAFLEGSGDVGSISPLGSDQICNVYIASLVSSDPCAQNADGVCDVNVQQSN